MVFVWTLSDLIGAILFGVVLLLMVTYGVATLIRQWRCDHEKHGYNETRACDAICQGCGKNLGFIGTIREQRKTK